MSFISQSLRGEVKPEEDLPYSVYIFVCFAYLALVMLAAIFIDDLTLIFGIIAGLAECSAVFILPCVFYLVACHRERKEHEAYQDALLRGLRTKKPSKKKGGGPLTIFFVYVYLICGVCYFTISNYFNFVKVFR